MKSRTQRTLLLAFIGSIACCGVVGIYCLLLGSFGIFEARIMGTTSVVGAASILGMVAAVPWERRRWHPLGPSGVGAVALALPLVIIAIWFGDSWDSEAFLRAVAVACVVAVALPHVGLLSLARLRRQYGWVRRVTIIVIIILGGLISYIILAEDDDDLSWRLTGILSIMVACGTIAVPILHRVSAIRARDEVYTTELSLTLTCPRCGKTQELPAGRSRCGGCGLKFSIEIEEENCRVCGYPLYRLTSAVCPECGTPIAQDGTT